MMRTGDGVEIADLLVLMVINLSHQIGQNPKKATDNENIRFTRKCHPSEFLQKPKQSRSLDSVMTKVFFTGKE